MTSVMVALHEAIARVGGIRAITLSSDAFARLTFEASRLMIYNGACLPSPDPGSVGPDGTEEMRFEGVRILRERE